MYNWSTLFPHIRPAGIIILHNLQMQVLLENTTFLLHKIVRIAGIIRVAGIIRGRALYEEIRYLIGCRLGQAIGPLWDFCAPISM